MIELIAKFSYEIKMGFTLGGTIFLSVFLWKSLSPREKWPNPMFKFLSAGIIILFISLGTYQAKWQLFGFFSSDFLRVQRGFDPRDDILGTRFHRGKIVDWKHRPLAIDRKVNGKLSREYPLGAAAVHTVGYIHPVFGASGLENALDSVLMGRSVQTPADALRLTANVFFHRKLRGNPVVLTIDRDLQQTVWDSLKGHSGAIAVIDPRDGSIRAMTSRPGYDPGKLDKTSWKALLNRKDSPFLNRACQGLYPPGSTFKPLVAAAGLDLGLNPIYTCDSSGYNCGSADPRVRDYDHYHKRNFKGHGEMNMSEALTKSCNVYFAQLAVELTAKEILKKSKIAGCSEGVQFAGPALPAEKGRLPDHSTWHNARTARFGIGQDDLLLTPLHLALITGAIGNGGVMFKPTP